MGYSQTSEGFSLAFRLHLKKSLGFFVAELLFSHLSYMPTVGGPMCLFLDFLTGPDKKSRVLLIS
jgi:hypothetical protein